MTNICTKVTVRKRPIKNGQTSLYLDFYPPIRNPKTGKLSRREYLGLYIYTNPVERFQQEYNKSMIQKAEIIKCRRSAASATLPFRTARDSSTTCCRMPVCTTASA